MQHLAMQVYLSFFPSQLNLDPFMCGCLEKDCEAHAEMDLEPVSRISVFSGDSAEYGMQNDT